MAEELGDVQVDRQRPRYNWAAWANGKAWKLVEGVDYRSAKSLISSGGNWAYRHDMKFTYTAKGDHVVVRFVPRDSPAPAPRKLARKPLKKLKKKA